MQNKLTKLGELSTRADIRAVIGKGVGIETTDYGKGSNAYVNSDNGRSITNTRLPDGDGDVETLNS